MNTPPTTAVAATVGPDRSSGGTVISSQSRTFLQTGDTRWFIGHVAAHADDLDTIQRIIAVQAGCDPDEVDLVSWNPLTGEVFATDEQAIQ